MAEQMIDEIYELCKRVLNETNMYVKFRIYAYKRGELMATVNISDVKRNAVYFICEDSGLNAFEKCKVHLERLLKDGIVGC